MPWTIKPQQLAKTVVRDTSRVMRFAALDILGQIIVVSPVDTGRFRGNWVVALRIPDRTVFVEGFDASAGSVFSDGEIKISRQRGLVTIWLTNSLPYAERLNEGHSTQAPANFVEMAVDRTARDVNRMKVIK